MKKYIPNDQYMMLQNHARVRKIYSSCKRDQRIFNVTGYENFIDKFSDPTLQLTFKNPLVEFWFGRQKDNHNYLKRLLNTPSLSNCLAVWGSAYLNCILQQNAEAHIRIQLSGFPGGTVVENLPANAGHTGWSGKIPHAAEQLGPWATITEPARLEPVLRNKRGRDSERPAHRDEEWPPLAATGESPRTETKTQHSHK